MTASHDRILYWANRTKCGLCRKRFDAGFLLPVEKIEHNVLHPNFNMDIVFHWYDTHGIWPDILMDWLIGSVYNMELTLMGFKK